MTVPFLFLDVQSTRRPTSPRLHCTKSEQRGLRRWMRYLTSSISESSKALAWYFVLANRHVLQESKSVPIEFVCTAPSMLKPAACKSRVNSSDYIFLQHILFRPLVTLLSYTILDLPAGCSAKDFLIKILLSLILHVQHIVCNTIFFLKLVFMNT
jgi:hypothetical protein